MGKRVFRITTMPASRPSNYCLSYFDDSVFLDFDNNQEDNVFLKRISFDGYGCCTLGTIIVPLNEQDSKLFKEIIETGLKDQKTLMGIIKKAIALNRELI